MKTLSGTLSGVSGEYFVAAELSRRGIIASITLRNTKGVDILASSSDASKTVAIQVKTKKGSGAFWVLGEKADNEFADNLFYVFVCLNWQKPPSYHIVPSQIVASTIETGYKEWLKTPGKQGKQHNANSMRKFFDKENTYLNRWDLLKLDML